MRILLITASALALTALGGCSNPNPPASATAYAPPPPVPTPLPEPRPSSEPQAVEAKAGAYGMPPAPIPYDQLTAYDQQMANSGRPRAEDESPPKNEKKSDEVFY
jgi:hypothetical protein